MPEPVPPPGSGPERLNPIQRSLLEGEVIEAVRTVYDPEIPVNVYDLGLIYAVDVAEDATVRIKMTLTSPACPVAGTLPGDVEAAARSVPGVKDATVELVWDPPFSIDRIPEHVRLELGFF
jgi:FeS assembly SUF system protein